MNFTVHSSTTRPHKRQRLVAAAPADIVLVSSLDDYRSLASTCTADFVIEFGCGVGETVEILSKRLSPDRVIGIDVTWKHIQTAKKTNPNIRFERLDCVEDADYVIKNISKHFKKMNIITNNYS